jgi:hypothetical protein
LTNAGDAPIKVDSRRVYAIAREVVGQLAKDLGFRREKAMLSWTRSQGLQHLTFWFQVSQYGWDKYAGSQFTVELRLSPKPEVRTGPVHARLLTLVTDADREEVRRRQNAIISRLVRPPQSYVDWLGSASVDAALSYLTEFEPVGEPYYPGKDIWFRYASENDVLAWCEFVRAKLPSAIEQFLKTFASA